MRSLNTFLLCLLCLVITGPATAAPDEEVLGKSKGYPYATSASNYLEEWNKVGSMTNIDKVFTTVVVKASSQVRPLMQHPQPPAIRYFINSAVQDESYLLENNRITSLLVMKGDQIITERYQYDRKPEMKFLSYSMAKTVIGVLVGAALKDGAIKSLDDTVETYVKELKGYPYGAVTIRNLLRMSSGIKWQETSGTGSADVVALGDATYKKKGSSGGLSFVKTLSASGIPQGAKWNYNSADTEVLGLVLRAATGKTVADYTSEKVWQKIGAESDASWAVDWSGVEASFAYFSARLRDYGCLALWMAEGMEGVVTPDYYREMVDGLVQPDYLKHRKIYKYYGYGYQTWILPYKTLTFGFVGSWGQRIVVQPLTKTVIVMTSARGTQNETIPELLNDIAIYQGLLRSAGARVEMYPVVP